MWRPAGVHPPRIEPGDVGDTLSALVTTALGLAVAIWLVDGVAALNPWGVVVAATAVGLGDLLLRPPLRLIARRGGVGAALGVGLLGQLVVAFGALLLAPGIRVSSLWSALWVLAIAAVVMATGRWVWGSHDNDYVVGDLVRRSRRRLRRTSGAQDVAAGPVRAPGLLVVQLDGVGRAVLDQAIEAGLAPTLLRWLTDGSHTLESWWASVPSSTPASQAGMLHGAADQIPAFRWWDRTTGRLVVTNHPADASRVEARLSDGEGLLAHGGTAVSTMFSGDAARSYLVMSRTRPGPRLRPDLGPGGAYLRFFASPFLLSRALTLSVGEVVKELYQARRQRVNDVRPRIDRGGWYVVLRAVTNVLLRDLSTSLVAEAMVRGDPTVFVDFVDYDEIAHHAGPTRPESLRAIEGLDGVLATLSRVASAAPRDYQVVVLSDHGQSLGPTFEQVEGRRLVDTVRALMAAPAAEGVQAESSEDWGPVNALLMPFARSGTQVAVGPERTGRGPRPVTPDEVPEVVVGASGNLGMVWFPRLDHRPGLDELRERWPGMVAGLAGRPGVGAVVVDSAQGLLAVGARGVHPLESGAAVEGEDPLEAMGPRAAADLARAGRLPHTGDLLLISAVSERGHVHAFEGQVGSHGGLGGPQNEAFVLHPTSWPMEDGLRGPLAGARWLVGADAVHAQLVAWQRAVGLRP
ncbi:MAG: alkaline phosphatase family protein [Actinobacteria bacterium]|nr:alkaline phosphatase family protein [Actinomycetota bacterium]MCG2797548.1 alkaline phosphatase family protein [Cellulomonas sp.]